jgi:hypothetical protein
MKTDQELKRNYLILFAILFIIGITVVLRSYSINLSILISYIGQFDQNRVVLGCISWIVTGSILSLISGFAIVKLLLKDIVQQSQEVETPETATFRS